MKSSMTILLALDAQTVCGKRSNAPIKWLGGQHRHIPIFTVFQGHAQLAAEAVKAPSGGVAFAVVTRWARAAVVVQQAVSHAVVTGAVAGQAAWRGGPDDAAIAAGAFAHSSGGSVGGALKRRATRWASREAVVSSTVAGS